MTRATCIVVACACACLGLARPAASQSVTPGRLEVSGGVRWFAPLGFGRVDADEATLASGTRSLFSTDGTLDASVGAAGLVSVALARHLRVEASVAYNPTALSYRVTGDTEAASATTVSAPVSQFLVEGGVLRELRRRGRVAPFVTGGAGYLRQLNDGRTLIETGTSFYGGGGLYYVRESAHPRRLKATGVRVDVRAEFLRGGVAPDRTTRLVPAVTAVFFARF